MHLAPIPLAQPGAQRRKKSLKAQELTDQVDDISILRAGDPDKKIVGFDIAVYEGLVMDRLNSRNLMRGQETQNKGRK